jgi:hypothetical protein
MPADAAFVNAPIPGMSLTSEPGNRPWENPPNLVSVEDAMEFYTRRILGTPENYDQVLDIIESGLPIRNVANILMKTSVMEGYHTIDVGILVLPVVEELLMSVADMHDVSYVETIDQVFKENVVSRRQARLTVQELQKSKATAAVEPTEQPKGLMAKPNDMVE